MARPKSFDQDAVLDQAMELFWDRGYEGTSLADLETHLGLGRQSLYNAFGDKHTLFLRALDRYRRGVGGAAMHLRKGTGLEAIRAFFRWGIEFLTVPARPGCLVINTIAERAGHDPQAMLQCNQAKEDLERGFRRALAQAKELGELPKSLDVEGTARLLVVHNYGLCVMAKTGAGTEELQAVVEILLASLK